MKDVKEKNWLVFWTVSGQELRTKRRIEKLIKDLKLEDKVESVFVPTIRTTRFIKRKRKPRLVDIIVEDWKNGIPVEFTKSVQSYPIGFRGKLSSIADLPYPVEEIKRGVYRFVKVDRYRLEDLFKLLKALGLKPTIMGINERVLPDLEKKLKEWGISYSIKRSVLKPGPGQYETIEETRVIEKPIYRGYIFIKMEEDQKVIDRITQMISRTRPIRARDPETGEPAYMKMSEEEIRRIEELIRQQEEESKRKTPFEVGDKVKIVEGAFRGRKGEVVDINEEKGLVKVKVKEFGKYLELDFRFPMVERIS
ncbi:MAG: hypothetical protein GXO39_00555 [Thermotogae bacterium]|nr:hypothetical protein [Thermotogota bacterium]